MDYLILLLPPWTKSFLQPLVIHFISLSLSLATVIYPSNTALILDLFLCIHLFWCWLGIFHSIFQSITSLIAAFPLPLYSLIYLNLIDLIDSWFNWQVSLSFSSVILIKYRTTYSFPYFIFNGILQCSLCDTLLVVVHALPRTTVDHALEWTLILYYVQSYFILFRI